MKLYDVVILTDHRYVHPKVITPYISNVLLEDEIVKKALESKGLKVYRTDWSDPEFDWTTTKIALFRTTWDYFDRFGEFSDWLKRVTQQTKLINTEEQIYWNIDKHYLLDLKEKGIRIPASVFIEKGSKTSLKEIHEKTGWKETVLKPTVSGAARHTYKLNANNLAAHEEIFQELIKEEAMMLQEFQKNVVLKGEISLMMMGGKYTHAIIKKAKPGDFRVQDDFGGSVCEYRPTPDEIAFAEEAFAACSPVPIYGRADIILNNNNQLAISELELIEPELWFRFNKPAADKLAETVKMILESMN